MAHASKRLKDQHAQRLFLSRMRTDLSAIKYNAENVFYNVKIEPRSDFCLVMVRSLKYFLEELLTLTVIRSPRLFIETVSGWPGCLKVDLVTKNQYFPSLSNQRHKLFLCLLSNQRMHGS